jgi:ABC-type bacteriocin/lantibiotic exporter with double-glycine peptidase domain
MVLIMTAIMAIVIISLNLVMMLMMMMMIMITNIVIIMILRPFPENARRCGPRGHQRQSLSKENRMENASK